MLHKTNITQLKGTSVMVVGHDSQVQQALKHKAVEKASMGWTSTLLQRSRITEHLQIPPEASLPAEVLYPTHSKC